MWRSCGPKGVVDSTLVGDAQVVAEGLGHYGGIACFLSKALDNDLDSRNHESCLAIRSDNSGLSATVGWVPTSCQMEDSLTRDAAGPVDALSATMSS